MQVPLGFPDAWILELTAGDAVKAQLAHIITALCAVLGHNFPDSPWYKEAFAKLQGAGVEPREDQGSWISKLFRGKTGQG